MLTPAPNTSNAPHPQSSAVPLEYFYFLRHGQTDWNLEKRVQGHSTNISLNQTGESESHAAAERLAALPLACIISSPLMRAHQTAQIVNAKRQLPLYNDYAFTERNPGAWQGALWDDLVAQHQVNPENERQRMADFFPHDAETHTDMDLRVFNGLVAAAKLYPSPFLIVSHGAAFRALSQTLLGISQYCPNAIPYCFRKSPSGLWTINEVQL